MVSQGDGEPKLAFGTERASDDGQATPALPIWLFAHGTLELALHQPLLSSLASQGPTPLTPYFRGTSTRMHSHPLTCRPAKDLQLVSLFWSPRPSGVWARTDALPSKLPFISTLESLASSLLRLVCCVQSLASSLLRPISCV